MNLFKICALTCLLNFWCHNKCLAQSSGVDSLLINAFASDALLPMLIDSAVKHSAEVERVGQTVEYAKTIGKLNKNSIYNGLAFVTSYNYGTNFSAINNSAGPGGGINALTKAQTGYYNIGVGFQLPITQIINRKSIIHADETLVKANMAEKEKSILYVKQDVIRVYQDLKLSQKLLTLSSKNKQASEINYSMAEKNFIQGQGTVIEITSIQDILNKASIAFETDLNRFQTNFMQLEALTGTDITKLIKQIK